MSKKNTLTTINAYIDDPLSSRNKVSLHCQDPNKGKRKPKEGSEEFSKRKTTANITTVKQKIYEQ